MAMRRVVTTVLVLGTSLAIAGATAGAAQAKGEFVGPITARASITGPGLQAPIVLRWRGDCGLVYGCSDLAQMDHDLIQVAMDTGVTGSLPSYARGFAAPASDRLGPGYGLRFEVVQDGHREVVMQWLYPYAPDHVWVYTGPGQSVLGKPLVPGWLPAPASMRTLLASFGLPAAPASVAARSDDAKAVAAASGPGPARPWAVAALVAGLALVVVAGSLLGRPRQAALGRA
jgi:hypothetical protein